MVRAVLPVLLAILITSCFKQADCIITASDYVKIDFYQLSDRKTKSLLIDSVTISGTDSVLYDSVQTSTLRLPVNPGSDTARFSIFYQGVEEFITVQYASSTRIISADCGAFNYYKDLQVIDTSFNPDHVKLVNNQLLFNPENQTYVTNLQIYF